MSAEPAIRAFDLGKRYALGERSGGYTLLSERLSSRVRRENTERREFWALRDIDFEVPRGGTFGIIGHNGAGKSTLLKILSRVTAPTTGGVDLNGRVGALLEVGTGFHPELTGGENIYLNGALLGMRRQEVARRFDEIVAFAGVERFVDTPVKRYSSGMYLRLAFAVAAHLEPEILIVDEVLSVGDLAFQEKCVGRMQTVAGEGRTVLFVSHNLTAVAALCHRSMLLSGGRKIVEGPTGEVIEHYVRSARETTGIRLDDRVDRDGSGQMRFTVLRLERDGVAVEHASSGEDVTIVLRYRTADGQPLVNAGFEVSVFSLLGDRLLQLSSNLSGQRFAELPPEGEVRCRLPRCPLPEGTYFLNVFANVGRDMLDWVQRAAELTVMGGDFYGNGRSPDTVTVLVDQAWSAGAALPASAG